MLAAVKVTVPKSTTPPAVRTKPAPNPAKGVVAFSPPVKTLISEASLPIVNVPELLKDVAVVTELAAPNIEKLFTPPPTFKVVKTRLPAKEAVPETLVNVTVPALKLFAAVTPEAEVTVTVPSGIELPTNPVNTTLPAVPAVSPRFWAPFSVFAKVTVAPAGDPPALVVSTNTPPVSVVAEL